MTNRLETQMLDALELFHYANRFRGYLFVIVLEDCHAINELMLDIRVLDAAQIRTLVLYPTDAGVAEDVGRWQQRGFPFHHYRNQSMQQLLKAEESIIEEDGVTICELKLDNSSGPYALQQAALQISEGIGADKVFFLGKEKGLIMGDRFLSHLHPETLEANLKEEKKFNIAPQKLDLLLQASVQSGIEVVLVPATMGSLFEETFTHRGSGTLLTNDYPNVIRRGRSGDLMDLFMLIKHEMRGNAILPVSEELLADRIANYFVFTVNNSIVAAATLTDYDNAAELAKFCTLPRYQGKGRAMQLAKSMVEHAADQGKDYVFALSINEKMWTFFKNLGFSEVERKELPQKWQDQYDFSRPSRAFRLML